VINDWLAAYGLAWTRLDAEALAALFTEDGTSANNPHAPPHRGREAIRSYWAAEMATQQQVRVRFGSPIVAGERVAVEWWASVRDGGGSANLAGCLVLRFAPGGRCAELREYWNVAPS
jgi:steroid delta-isomerase